MCRLDRVTSENNRNGGSASLARRLPGLAMDASLLVYTLGFVCFRVGELIPLVSIHPLRCASTLVFGTVLLRRVCPGGVRATRRRLIHVFSLLALARLLDAHLPRPPPPVDGSRARTVLITGGNSGVGYETARRLAVTYGKNVILGCRSEAKCAAAADAIDAEAGSSGGGGGAAPIKIDLSDFDSVASVAERLVAENIKIDVLFNNAGYAPVAGVPADARGLDPSFADMHLSHFLLTETLLRSNPEMRVVLTSSGTHHLCAIPFVLPRYFMDTASIPHGAGCVDEEYLEKGMYGSIDRAAYIRAKAANMMHAVEIPRRHAGATAVAVDLGWVGTAIQPFMLTALSPTALGWMRNVEVGVMPVIRAILVEDEQLLQDLRSQRGQWKEGGIAMNVFGDAEEAFTYNWWKESAGTGRSRMLELSNLLWDVSNTVLRKNGYLSTNM